LSKWAAVDPIGDKMLCQIRGENLNNIGEQFNIKAYSTVSRILRRVLRLKKYDRKIKKTDRENSR
jgi:hypothetical protein